MKNTNCTTILKGVSTLDVMKKHIKAVLFLMMLTALSAAVFGGHSTLDIVDPNFNPQIQSDSYDYKQVYSLKVQPDGKILVFGNFTSYNRIPVGRVVRLNPDGSLDPSFNNQTVTSTGNGGGSRTALLLQPDGKIVILNDGTVAGGQSPRWMVRLNADGTLDTSFNFTSSGTVRAKAIDSLGRIYLAFTPLGGSTRVNRLNTDGSIDSSFQYTPPANINEIEIASQGSSLIVNGWFSGSSRRLYRLNENGSDDSSFNPSIQSGTISQIEIQPDNKILYLRDKVYRLNENGSTDTSFQPIAFTGNGSWAMKSAPDGKIFTTSGFTNSTVFRRYLSSGVEDTSFTPYTHRAYTTYVLEADGNLLIGDYLNLNDASIGINNFIRLRTLDSTPDPAFNPGGIGFQTMLPGSIWAIEPLPNGKIMLGGKFDAINGIQRTKLARMNSDSTVDATFQINTSGAGNYFSRLETIYQIYTQSDGKIIVSGWFDYVFNGVAKRNLVRLNADGTIDAAFNLTEMINDYSEIVGAGRNRFINYSDGKLMIGISKSNGFGPVPPLKLTESGSRDLSFDSMLNPQSVHQFIDDIALQPDGKILVAGSHRSDFDGFKSFIARLNADGSLDSTFPYNEETGRIKQTLKLFSDGKILVGKHTNGATSGTVQRLNSNGSIDNTFSDLTLPAGIINAMLVLPSGKIFVGGKFTVSINGQTRRNLLQLGADGSLEPTVYNVNEEVLCLAADNQGRVLVGGGFTVIGANGAGAPRSYIARLIDSRTRFDFDGDGRADLGVFNNTNGDWTILNSGANQAVSTNFGLNNDKTAPADYDGDGRADIAVFRPSNGVWYLLKSRDGFSAIQWGLAEDKPVAADYDGDGLADIAVWRPSSSVWYIRQSSNGQVVTMQFGLPDDVPLTAADFDGDGKADIAVWRPSNGVFYWMASGAAAAGSQFRAVQFGLTGDVPVVGDYNGDGKTDLVVFRPSEGNWYQYLTQPNGGYIYSIFNFGINGDEPVAADYNGDGKTDFAVRRQNVWHINRTGQGYISTAFADAEHKAVASSLNR